MFLVRPRAPSGTLTSSRDPCLRNHAPPQETYESKPDEYVSHLIGHESTGSLLSALKAKGLASGLCAGVSEGGHERSTAAWLFGVGITLTDAGVARWTEAVDLLFAYVDMMRKAGPQKWIFEEISAIKARAASCSEGPVSAPMAPTKP